MDYDTLNMIFRCNRTFGHKRSRGRGLTDTEYMLCSFVRANPGSSQDEVALALKTDKTSIAKACASLEEKGIIIRKQDPRDRRFKRLHLTEKGRRSLRKLKDIHDEWLTRTLDCLSEEEQAQLKDYCQRILARALTLEAEENAKAVIPEQDA